MDPFGFWENTLFLRQSGCAKIFSSASFLLLYIKSIGSDAMLIVTAEQHLLSLNTLQSVLQVTG